MTLDHFHPANMMPYFDDESNRRAVPAYVLYDQPGLQGYLFLPSVDAAGGDPWRVISGVDQEIDGRVIVEYDTVSEQYLEPDSLQTFLGEKNFQADAKAILVSLKNTYDLLWDQHRRGAFSRDEFERRAEALRDLREKYRAVTL